MAHWPTIAATTTLAAFLVAGAMIHVGGTGVVSGIAAPAGAGWSAAAGDSGSQDATLPGVSARTAIADNAAPAAASASGVPALHADLTDRAAAAREGAAPAQGLRDERVRLPSVSARQDGGIAAGHEIEVSGILPPDLPPYSPRMSGPINAVPLPPLPPQPPASPERPATGLAVQGLRAGTAAGIGAGIGAGVQARMAVAMPLSIPELGPLDPAKLSSAARELAEAIHVVASRAGSRAMAADAAAAGASATRKRLEGCQADPQARSASLPGGRCGNAGL